MKRITFLALCLLLPAISLLAVPAIATVKFRPQKEGSVNLPATREAKWPLLVGKWFGNMNVAGGGKYMWIAERKNDGSYKIQFRTVDPSGKKEEQTEVGEWGVSGNIYFTIYKAHLKGGKAIPADPTNPGNRDAYRILKLTNEVFEYEHLDEGVRFTVKKVAQDFVFPE